MAHKRPGVFKGQVRGVSHQGQENTLHLKAEYIDADFPSFETFPLHSHGGPYIRQHGTNEILQAKLLCESQFVFQADVVEVASDRGDTSVCHHAADLRRSMTVRDWIELDLREPCIVNRTEYSGKVRLRLLAQHKELYAKGHSRDGREHGAACAK